MRELVRFGEPHVAAQLGDILLAEGVETTINLARDGQTIVWVHEETQLERARVVAAEFQQSPNDPRFAAAIGIAKARRLEKKKAAASRPPLIRARARFLGLGRSIYALGPLSAALILASVVVAVLTRLGERDDMVALFSYASYLHDGTYVTWKGLADIRGGQIYRVLTPMFIHFGFPHLLFNMWWLKDLGSMIERRQSSLFLGALVVGVAAASNSAQYLMSGPSFGGMSGVVYGLFGYVWVRGRFDSASGYVMSQRDVVWMLLWLVACGTGFVGPVANTAHAVGLGAGALWGFLGSGYLQRRLLRR